MSAGPRSSKTKTEKARRAILDVLAGELALMAVIAWRIGMRFDARAAIFVDPRPNGSMFLTRFGFELLSEKYPTWSEELKHPLTLGDHTYLINVSSLPYFCDGNRLITFDADLGVMLKMVSADFSKMERLRPRN